jgi:predicted HNH restriction endonuclease
LRTAIRAFKTLQSEGLFDKPRALLQAHFNAPNRTATWAELAKDVGYTEGRAINLHYGKLAQKVAGLLGVSVIPGVPGNKSWLFVLIHWAEDHPSGHTSYVLRRPVVEALTQLDEENLHFSLQSWEKLDQELDQKVKEAQGLSLEERRKRLAESPKQPKKILVNTTMFLRSPYVIAEVLARATGVCESCHASAPFLRGSDGTPYLEVHHQVRLADGGEDTILNARALCPNCHRRAHYG